MPQAQIALPATSRLGVQDFPKDLAQSPNPRTNRKHRFDVAAADMLVMSNDLNLPEARAFQNSAHAVWVSKREWAGRVRVVRGLRRQMNRRGSKRQDVKRILLQRAPADEREPSIRF